METPIPVTNAPATHEPAGYAPISTTASRSPAPSADQIAAMDALTARMAGMDRDPAGRERLVRAVHDEISAGGSGLLALGADPARMAAEAQHKSIAAQFGDAAAAGATPAEDYSAFRPEIFASPEERTAFGTVLSQAGIDVRVIQSLVPDVAGDPRVAAAIRGGEAGMDRRAAEVRQFFERQPGGMDDLRLAVAFGESLVAKDARLQASFDAAILSESALHALAGEARRLGFTAPTRR